MTGSPREQVPTPSARRGQVDLSVLVVSYNTRELTLACLRSLMAGTRAARLEVLVLDNASHDGSAEAVAAEFPRTPLVASQQNFGFGAANNLLAQQAVGRYLLLLNPDTVVLDGAVDELLDFAIRRPEAGIWGGRTLFPDRALNKGSCWAAPTLWSTLCLALGLTRLFPGSLFFNPEAMGSWKRNDERGVDIVAGCFLLIERALWDRLGGFHPAFFMYGEDADLCLRAKRFGARPMITPKAEIVHYAGASERVRADKMVRLFTAKAQMFGMHWAAPRGRMGVACLDLWASSRLVSLGLLRRVRPRRFRGPWEQWRQVWSRRGDWRGAFRRSVAERHGVQP